MTSKPHTVLKQVFGYDDFLPFQEEIIRNVLDRKDTLAVMPTGGGKSLCYQIPALIFDGLTIVISPLISLMQDQIMQLSEMAVPAVSLNSQLTIEAYRRNVSRIKRREAKLLYLAPETFLKPDIMALLASVAVDCLAVDEAHCISKWGHDFRPEYRQLVKARSVFKAATWIALTATATPRVQQDIKDTLKFDDANQYVAPFDRGNLFIQVVEKNDALAQTLRFLDQFAGESGIIYCATRKQVDGLQTSLADAGVSVRSYHAGLSDKQRRRHQHLFITDNVRVIVATIAFGMGINKPNVRFVVHYDLPQTMENYYQEIGRAGRDGLRADCLLLFSYGDIHKIRYFIQKKTGHEQRLANIQMNALLQFAESQSCRRMPLLHYFGESHSGKCNMCDNCLISDDQAVDVTVAAQKFLSCVKRTGERFGAAHVIDVLRGSKSSRILKCGHQGLSTHGIGREFSKKQWLHLSRQFLVQGLVVQDMEYGGLQLTPRAYEVFKGKTVLLRRIPHDTAARAGGPAADVAYDRNLFEILRQKRKEMADQAGVPPYVIFPDRTLVELAAFLPRNLESLRSIQGVGAVKLERYGRLFLDLITDYCAANQISPKAPENPAAAPEPEPKVRRHIVIAEDFNSGQSLDQIMQRRQIKLNTVLDHLHQFVQEGHDLNTERLLDECGIASAQKDRALARFEALGCTYLKPVFEDLDQTVSYDTLKILRLYYLSRR